MTCGWDPGRSTKVQESEDWPLGSWESDAARRTRPRPPRHAWSIPTQILIQLGIQGLGVRRCQSRHSVIPSLVSARHARSRTARSEGACTVCIQSVRFARLGVRTAVPVPSGLGELDSFEARAPSAHCAAFGSFHVPSSRRRPRAGARSRRFEVRRSKPHVDDLSS